MSSPDYLPQFMTVTINVIMRKNESADKEIYTFIQLADGKYCLK